MKLIFSVFDLNDDGYIDEFDIFSVLKLVDFSILKDQIRSKRNPFMNVSDK